MLASPRRRALKGKRTLLLGEVLEELGFRDFKAAKDLAEGLVGPVGDCDAFLFSFQLAALAVSDLDSSGPVASKSILSTTQGTADQWVDGELWLKTCKEIEKGWLSPVGNDEAVNTGCLLRGFAVVRLERLGASTITANLRSMTPPL